jgi:hypothetical protein
LGITMEGIPSNSMEIVEAKNILKEKKPYTPEH